MVDVMHNKSALFLIICTIIIINHNKMLTKKDVCATIGINQT